MKKESDKQVHISKTYNFYGNIGQHIDHIENQYVTFDKDMQMVIGNEVQRASNSQGEHVKNEMIDPTPLIFKPNEQNHTAIEELLKMTLCVSNKKSVICRKLYEQRELFNLHAQDDTQKAVIINAWVKKIGIEAHFKNPFSHQDFYAYYGAE